MADGILNGNTDLSTTTGATTTAETGSQVSPEMLYKLSKKIAQLTKVIYSLNTRNDDLELDLENVKNNYEEKLASAAKDYQTLLNNSTSVAATVASGAGSTDVTGTDVSAASDILKKELKRAKHAMKSMESKMVAKEEEHKLQLEMIKMEISEAAAAQAAAAAVATPIPPPPPPEPKTTNAIKKLQLLEQQVSLKITIFISILNFKINDIFINPGTVLFVRETRRLSAVGFYGRKEGFFKKNLTDFYNFAAGRLYFSHSANKNFGLLT